MADEAEHETNRRICQQDRYNELSEKLKRERSELSVLSHSIRSASSLPSNLALTHQRGNLNNRSVLHPSTMRSTSREEVLSSHATAAGSAVRLRPDFPTVVREEAPHAAPMGTKHGAVLLAGKDDNTNDAHGEDLAPLHHLNKNPTRKPTTTKVSRKRRRVILPLLTSSSTTNPPTYSSSPGSVTNPTSELLHQQKQPHSNSDASHLVQMLLCLLLTTGLALVAAWDAKEQCIQHETSYALDQLVDDYYDRSAQNGGGNGGDYNNNAAADTDDSSQQQQDDASLLLLSSCREMFDTIIVPTSAATMGLAVLAIAWIRKCGCQYRYCCTSSLSTTGVLLLLSFGMAAAQTYEILSVMLRPRVLDQESGTSSSSTNSHNNPYQSLAAVDKYGHVGDNANLFFLSWISESLALALLYQLLTAFVRLYWKYRKLRTNHTSEFLNTSDYDHDDEDYHDTHYRLHMVPSGLGNAENGGTTVDMRRRLLPATSWMEHEKSELKKWYQTVTLYRLRFRTGIWVATLVACLVIVASSLHVWKTVLIPNAGDLRFTHICQAQRSSTNTNSNNNHRNYYYNHNRKSARMLCQRTVTAWCSGVIASILCATAIGMHLTSRRRSRANTPPLTPISSSYSLHHDPTDSPSQHRSSDDHYYSHHHHELHRLPLTTELVLSILMSLLLGFNAVFSTGVQGPAATVGNLYFASWLAFFLCVRICLGCVEEAQNLDHHHGEDDDHEEHHNQAKATTTTTESSQEPPKPTEPTVQTIDLIEKDRGRRLRSYFFLSIFSMVCAASAYDAASNQRQQLSQFQLYMMLSPCVVATISGIQFVLCLSKSCYAIVSRFYIGGILSMLCFALWLTDLVLTMHSEDSWAVNGVGEIEVANLYFYSWAGILSAGLLMMSYFKALFEIKHTDYMSLVWIGICKVCFVILGAALHIWHTIADNCEFDEITSGAVTFCSRTILAIVVSLAGMLVGGLVVAGRLMVALCRCSCIGPRTQAHVEMIVAIFLVLLFSATVALITGIGGPGQSVGDLYFSTWLSFAVALGIFVQCEAQVRKDKSLPNPAGSSSACASLAEPSNNSQVIVHPPANGSVLV